MSERNRQADIVKRIAGLEKIEGNLADWSEGGPTWLRDWFGDRPFVTFDRVVNIGWVTDADLARLSELPDLKTIHFGMCTVSKLRIDALAACPNWKRSTLVSQRSAAEEEKRRTIQLCRRIA